jgi:hypothetical protein
VTHVRWAKGGEAAIVALDAERVTLSSERSAPPGAVVEGALLNDGTTLRIKVRGCRRDGERFRIEGRILDLSKSLRERLGDLVPKP